MTVPYIVHPVRLDDAEAYVGCHVDCLAETYATIMPRAFAEEHQRTLPEQVERTREAWRALADEPDPHTSAWLARDTTGAVVGVVRAGRGAQPWERALAAPRTTVPYQLHHLYTRARTHGTGLGRLLLATALADRPSYLWILHGNARADAFYRREGFGPDGAEMSCGPTWFHRTMYRLIRPVPDGPVR